MAKCKALTGSAVKGLRQLLIVAYLSSVNLSINQMFGAFLTCLSPVKVKLRNAVLVCIWTAFQRYITMITANTDMPSLMFFCTLYHTFMEITSSIM